MTALFLSVLVASPSALAALNVVTTTQDLAAIATAIGGSDASVNYIARGDLDPHFIDAKPSFMVKLSQAKLVLSVGMELEVGWLPNLITGSRNPAIAPGSTGYLDLSTVIDRIEVPTGSIDRSRGDLHPQGNPHYWLNPENGRKMARAIAARMESLDPVHAANYNNNLLAFEATLTQKQASWASRMAPYQGTAVVGYHSTFDYFCDTYGLKVVGFIEPKPGIPATPQHTLEISAAAKAAGAKWIFVEPYKSVADANTDANASGAKALQIPTSVGADESIKTYFDLFDAILTRLGV